MANISQVTLERQTLFTKTDLLQLMFHHGSPNSGSDSRSFGDSGHKNEPEGTKLVLSFSFAHGLKIYFYKKKVLISCLTFS